MKYILILISFLTITGCSPTDNSTINPHKIVKCSITDAKIKVLDLMTQAGYELEDETNNRQMYTKQESVASSFMHKALVNMYDSTGRYKVSVIFVDRKGSVLVKAYSSMNRSGIWGQQKQDSSRNVEVEQICTSHYFT